MKKQEANTIEPNPVFIDSNNIKATNNRHLAWWVLFISIGYQYKLIFCGGLGVGLGQTWICYTMIHGISTNHWFEHLVFAPLMWVSLFKINEIIFGPAPNEVLSKKQKQKKWIGIILATLYFYGYGLHLTNTVEIWSREHQGITIGAVYDQIRWLDEQFSHWVQFIAYFPLIAWFVINDRLDRNHAKNMAIITGVLHGVDRGVNLVEGDNYFLGYFLIGLLLTVCVFRWFRHGSNFWRSWQDFFFRHVLIFSTTMILVLSSYAFFFGLDAQPSEMGDGVKGVVALGVSIIVLLIGLVFGLDKLMRLRMEHD